MQHQNNVNRALPAHRFEMLANVKSYLIFIEQINLQIHGLFRSIGDLTVLNTKKQSFKELLIQASADVETSISNTSFMRLDSINRANKIQNEILIHEDSLRKLKSLVDSLIDIRHFLRNCKQESMKITEASVLSELTTLKDRLIKIMQIIFDHAEKDREIYRFIPNIHGLPAMITILSQETFVLATNEKPSQQVDTATIVNELTKRYTVAPIKASKWSQKIQNNPLSKQKEVPQTLPLYISDPEKMRGLEKSAQSSKFFTEVAPSISNKRPCPSSPDEQPPQKQLVTESETTIDDSNDIDYWNQLETSLKSLPNDDVQYLELGGDDMFGPTI